MSAAKKAHKGPTPVEATIHQEKRANLPTADAQEFLSPEVEEIPKLRYPRDPTLDPQLVWRGKDEQDGEDLEVDAPPIYIQEKIDPRVLIENLRKTAKAGQSEPELSLFETFDGLSELDLVDFYRHDANWSNRMILGDSLQVMASLSEREALRGKVQMVYVDPPYGIKFGSNWQVSARKPRVTDGRAEDRTREVEAIKAFRDTWELGIHSYLSYLRDRLHVARDMLTSTGSVFVQIGDENVHLVRAVLDEVFGSENFVSIISFKKTAGLGSDGLAAVADFLLWYGKDRTITKQNLLFRPKVLEGDPAYASIELVDGKRRRMTADERRDHSQLPKDSRVFRNQILLAAGRTESCVYPVEIDGEVYQPTAGRSWATNADGMRRLIEAGRVAVTGSSLSYIRYSDDFPVNPLANFWEDTASGSGMDKVYVVQTNTRIVERCVLMTTDPGDLVIDPTCGSGTTAFVAEHWGRRWITIDSSRVALALARQRLMASRFPYYLLSDSIEGRRKEAELSDRTEAVSATAGDVRRGFVYERAQHVTLRAIANNPDIGPDMTRDAIAAVIKRYAEFEVLFDRPYEDKSKVRVSGPFTVESLSPHRSLAFTSQPTGPDASGALDLPASSFESMILENLRKAGVQNGKRQERLQFDVIEAHAGEYVQAIGTRQDVGAGPRRVGIAIGPQYGTVSPSMIKKAALEVIRADEVDLLCVLGFAFDPLAVGADDGFVSGDKGFDVAAERSLGRIPVLLVRMNSDLLMGEELKKTGAGNLFTVFGEPDISINVDGSELRVSILGVDVYDPTTDEIRSNSTDQIALWMIDTNYNEESFFVRECYFTGGQDPYKRLKSALNADIDEEAWASLYRTTSRKFPKPLTGKIAVKVINDYGDEVMKVFEVT